MVYKMIYFRIGRLTATTPSCPHSFHSGILGPPPNPASGTAGALEPCFHLWLASVLMGHARAFVVVKGLLVLAGRLHTVRSCPPAPGTVLLSLSWIPSPSHTALPWAPGARQDPPQGFACLCPSV